MTRAREIWTNPQAAKQWSEDPIKNNPTRPEQLDILISVLADVYQSGKTILDIGIGSGIVESLIFQRIPDAQIIGIDVSPAMVELAHQCLKDFEDRYSIVFHDLTALENVDLPERDYQIVFSVQTIHNISDEHKVNVLKFAHRVLGQGGLFFLLDRFSVSSPELFPIYRSVWQRVNRVYDANVDEGSTFEAHLKHVENNGDLPASVEQHFQWFREVGFEVACLHQHGNRALLVAQKNEV